MSYPYTTTLSYQLPPTPPKDLVHGYKDHQATLPYHPGPYNGPRGGRPQDDRSHDYSDQYGSISQPPAHPPMYYPLVPYPGASTVPPSNSQVSSAFYKGILGPILPPIRTYERSAPGADRRQVQEGPQKPYVRHDMAQTEPKEERPVGGVSAKLDYEMDMMADYVTETAHAIIMPNRPVPTNFRKWVNSVLSATRLPSSTILLAFDYLSVHMRIAKLKPEPEPSDGEFRLMLTTSLILGSKFLDDNTFINRSWAEVSGIEVLKLNKMELKWLTEVDFHLHRDLQAPHGFQSFLAHWKQYEAEVRQARGITSKPITHNANMHSTPMYSPVSQSFNHTSPPPPYSVKGQMQYPTPSYSRYEYVSGRSSSSTSPASAPHTGPTTPEYYGPQSTWASVNGTFVQGRLAPPAYTQSIKQAQSIVPTQPIAPPNTQQAGYAGMGYVSPVHATGHGADCFCMTCNRRFMMVPDFGVPQSVAS